MLDKGKKVAQDPAKGSVPTKSSGVVSKAREKNLKDDLIKILRSYTKLMSNESLISIPMEVDIFGWDAQVSVDKYELLQFIKQDQIGVSTISIWMRLGLYIFKENLTLKLIFFYFFLNYLFFCIGIYFINMQMPDLVFLIQPVLHTS